MSKQLNDLLNDLKKWIDSPLDEIDKNYGIWELDVNQSKELLSYINQLQQENKQLKEQLLEQIRNNYKLQDELNKKTKEYQETYKDVREEIKDYKTQLKQRDEVIEELEEFLKEFHNYENRFKWCEQDYIDTIKKFEEILQKYKGDNK